MAKEKAETSKEIIKDIEKSGVSEEIAEKEEKLDEKAMKKEAEKESTTTDIEQKKKALLAKAAELKKKVEKAKTEELKEKVRIKKKTEMLVPLEEYVKAGIYLGTRVVTPNMRPFVYRRRADGLAIFNTDTIDEKLKEGTEFLSKFAPEDVILVCKRQAGWKAAEKFSEITGIRVFTQKYPAGVLTNKQLPEFFENELTIITDHWVDKNALNDTLKVHKKVLMICDTNNFSKGADVVVIGNNKSQKSLGLIFYLLAREYCKARKIEADIPDLEWWTGEEEEKETLKKKDKSILAEPGAQFGV
jgi:small subunit ribosomal protein S2